MSGCVKVLAHSYPLGVHMLVAGTTRGTQEFCWYTQHNMNFYKVYTSTIHIRFIDCQSVRDSKDFFFFFSKI